MSMKLSEQIVTDDKISIFRKPDRFTVIVPGSRKVGGGYILDEDLLKLVVGKNSQRYRIP